MRFDLSLRIGNLWIRLRVIQFDERGGDPHMLTDSKIQSAKPLAKSYKLTVGDHKRRISRCHHAR